ncbi:type II secretion system protein [Parasalinivibrio latis]|uniref:type II secretion system protein n=1 Tax=Parasalinivibrio latis TaxID=2952610 RepID=UPI003DA507CC
MESMPKIHKQGFTLIELVVVIVILGILSVTAAPKFLNFSSDAKKSAVKAIAGSMQEAATLYQLKDKLSICGTQNYSVVEGASIHWGAVYSGDWDISLNSDCSYNDLTLDGIPEIFEAMSIDIKDFWLVHTRNEPAPNRDVLWVAPYPPENKKGIHVIAHNAYAENADDIKATNCYIRYATPRNNAKGDALVSYVVSGC